MKNFLDEIVGKKQKEVELLKCAITESQLEKICAGRSNFRDFHAALSDGSEKVKIIAEIKRASPSKGIIKADLDPEKLAAIYETGGACAVSVLTERDYFLGSPEDLRKARAACNLPVLRKDFILCSYQVYEACAIGADAVLLIARILEKNILKQLCDLTFSLGMEPLAEIHSADDAKKIRGCGARLVLINNRDLSAFKTSLDVAVQLGNSLEKGQIPIAASGINSREDIEKNIAAGITGFLVGESIVRSENPQAFIRNLKGIT